jgi:hypothetical protein
MQDTSEDMMERLTKPSLRENDVPPKERLSQFLRSLPTSSAISSMIYQLSRLLLLHTAKRLRCSHLLLCDSLTSLSVSLISSIASGDGLHIGNEREEIWESIQVVKPLRDVASKECAAAFHWRQLHMIGTGNVEHSYLGITKVARGLSRNKLERIFLTQHLCRIHSRSRPRFPINGECNRENLCQTDTEGDRRSLLPVSAVGSHSPIVVRLNLSHDRLAPQCCHPTTGHQICLQTSRRTRARSSKHYHKHYAMHVVLHSRVEE